MFPDINWAVPSCALPGTIAYNARFMANKAPGIELCFFETAPCCDYTEDDIPGALAELPLHWHMHLPFDLPWCNGGSEVAAVCNRLYQKAAMLSPGMAVLHPPVAANKKQLLEEFASQWECPLDIFLENTLFCDLTEFGQDWLEKNNFGVCIDVGHALGYGQKNLLHSQLPAEARIFHWSAPMEQDRHLPLSQLGEAEYAMAVSIMEHSDRDALHVVEVFSWEGITDSLLVLRKLWNTKYQ